MRRRDGAVRVRPRPHQQARNPLSDAVVRALGPLVAAGLLLAAIPEASSARGGIDLVLAVGLIAAGSVAWFLARWVCGSAAILAGACLGLATAGEATSASPGSLAVGLVAAPLVAPLLALAIVRPTAAWIALLGGVAAGPIRALVYDPFLDPDCAQRCLINPLALTHDTAVADGLHRYGTLVAAVALTTLLARQARRWQVATVAAAAWSLVFNRATDLMLIAAAVALLVVTTEVVELVGGRRRVRSLARTLATTGDVEAILRRELHDDDLTVSYWISHEKQFVRADGAPARAPGSDQETTEIRSGGELRARVDHVPGAAVRELAATIDGSTRLALDNERLGAQVAVQLAALRESRARIVEQADTTRRTIERDVHDGAQQHVLALGLELNVALAKLGDNDPRRATLQRCVDETNLVLDELRDLSHGIYPASLEAGGLAHGLRTLAGRSLRPLQLVDVPLGRYDPPIERAAFQLVADAADRADRALDVLVEAENGTMSVRITGTSLLGDVVADRIAAAGGTLLLDGDTIVATFPCAS